MYVISLSVTKTNHREHFLKMPLNLAVRNRRSIVGSIYMCLHFNKVKFKYG